jgi:hypothetical protein
MSDGNDAAPPIHVWVPVKDWLKECQLFAYPVNVLTTRCTLIRIVSLREKVNAKNRDQLIEQGHSAGRRGHITTIITTST